jgi:hypothetical protein
MVNLFYLIVGILSILFAFTHALNGHNTILNLIYLSKLDLTAKTTIFYVWHIISVENLIFGIAFLVMAFYKNQSKLKFTAYLIVTIIFARWCVILCSTLMKNMNGIKGTLIDSIAIIVFIALIILGTMRKDKAQS